MDIIRSIIGFKKFKENIHKKIEIRHKSQVTNKDSFVDNLNISVLNTSDLRSL